VEYIAKKAGQRMYMLCKLDRVGFAQNDLVNLYISEMSDRFSLRLLILYGTLNGHNMYVTISK